MNLNKTIIYLFLLTALYTPVSFTMDNNLDNDWELVGTDAIVEEIVSKKTIPEKIDALSNYLTQVLKSLKGESDEGDTVSH